MEHTRIEKGEVGGVLILDNHVQLSWHKYFKTCSSIEYAEATKIFEAIAKAVQTNL